MHYVFVYGTLKAGYSNHDLLKAANFIGRAVTLRPFFMSDTGGFPVVFDDVDIERQPVKGEVYEIDDHTLARLDRLEGHPNMFERRQIEVDLDDTGIHHTCWMYHGVPDHWSAYRNNLGKVQPVTVASGAVYEWSPR